MKVLLVLFLSVISISLRAQYGPYAEEGKGFNSVFQKLESGSFQGRVSGILNMHHINGDGFTYSFFEDSMSLKVEKDFDYVYDISYKHYAVKKGEMELDYRTYYNAHRLKITIGNKTYDFNLIDGSCEAVMKGLDYTYLAEEDKELLFIYFSQDVALMSEKKGPTAWELFVEKGSVLCFNITR